MSATANLERRLLVAVAVLFSLRIFIGVLAPSRRPRLRRGTYACLLAVVVAAGAMFANSVTDRKSVVSLENHASSGSKVEVSRCTLTEEMEELKLKIGRLESRLEETSAALISRTETLEEHKELVLALEHDIQSLMHEQAIRKQSSGDAYTEENVRAMESEVQRLTDKSRELTSNILVLETLANNAEKKVEALNLEVKKVESIIAEKWIQVRQFEQAFVLKKMMAEKVRKRNREMTSFPGKDALVKTLQFLEYFHLHYISNITLHTNFVGVKVFLGSYIHQAHCPFKRVPTMIGTCAHKVTGFYHHHVPDAVYSIYSFVNPLFNQARYVLKRIPPMVATCAHEVIGFYHCYVPDAACSIYFFVRTLLRFCISQTCNLYEVTKPVFLFCIKKVYALVVSVINGWSTRQ